MAHAGATRAVIRNLSRETGIWDSPGDRFSRQDLQRFIADSKRWLLDKSNLKGSTIGNADWAEVYAYFRDEES